jgi:hypothetical protein
MKLLCLFVLISSFSYAGEVIWQTKRIGELTSTLSTAQLYLAKRIRLIKIEKQVLGKPTSPFYLEAERIFRNYQNGSLCYKVAIEDTRAIAYSKRCEQTDFFITLNDKRYDEVQDLTSLGHFKLSHSQKIAAKSFMAFHHQADEILSNLPRIDRYPFSMVAATITKSESLKINKNSVSLTSTYKLTRSSYAFLSERLQTSEHVLEVEPLKGDRIFSDGVELILFKRYQPSPFTFHLMALNDDYLDHLANVETYFFQHKDDSKCFRDNLLSQNQHDCDYLIFKKKSLVVWKELGLVKVSEQQGQLKTELIQ